MKTRRPIWLACAGSVPILCVALATWYVQWKSDPEQDHHEYVPRIGSDAPFITSPDIVVEKMVEVAELTPDDLVYDLGCGDGRIVITAALKSGCRGVGYDIDPERVAEARENVIANGVATFDNALTLRN